jgi:hypothetical protein
MTSLVFVICIGLLGVFLLLLSGFLDDNEETGKINNNTVTDVVCDTKLEKSLGKLEAKRQFISSRCIYCGSKFIKNISNCTQCGAPARD